MQPTDLRTRLQQRRDRIAAGKPIPEAVTMTANFFDPLMLNRSRVCRQCHKRFPPIGKDVMCKKCREREAA